MAKDNIEAVYRLTPVQEGMLFHTLYSPGSGTYFEQYACALRGDLDVPVFERVWDQVVERHAALRTLFTWEKRDKPLQIVREHVRVPWEHQDWRGMPANLRNQRLTTVLKADREQGFTLDRAPLMRFLLIRFEDTTHRFVWSFHHLLLDGWSVRLVLKEVFARYQAFRDAGNPVSVTSEMSEASPTRPFRDFVSWLERQDPSPARAYWSKELAGFTAPTRLPAERGYPGVSGHRDAPSSTSRAAPEGGYAQRQFELAEAATSALQSMAMDNRLTLNTIVQGAWALLLNRYTGDEDLVFGATVATRPASLNGVENMVGLFINTLPVRIRMSNTESLRAWLDSIQAQMVAMRQHEHSALLDIQRWSDIPHARALFESILVFQNHPLTFSFDTDDRLKIADPQYLERSNYPLAILVSPDERLRLIAIYDTARFEAQAIDRMLGHLGTVLEGIAGNPDGRLSELSLLCEDERRMIAVQWNDTGADFPRDACIHHLIERQAETFPDKVAVAFPGQELTYLALNRRANQLANHLQALGVGPETCVAVCMQRSIEMIVAILGILKSGGAYVPIEPDYPPERQALIVEDAGARVLLTAPQSPAIPCDCPTLRLDADFDEIARSPEHPPASVGLPENLAYVIYTSGSTGAPKGVQVTHRNLVHSTCARTRYYADPVERFLLLSSIAFDSSVAGIFWTLSLGGTLVLPPHRIEQDMGRLAALIAEHAVSHTLLLPSLYHLLLDHAEAADLQSMRTVIVAGEACAPDVLARHHAKMTHATLFNEYGPTEGTVWCTVFRVPPESVATPVPIGRPPANTRIYLLDATRQLVPVGVPGELHIGGEGVARGYLNRAELTDDRFLALRIGDGPEERVYRTGDLARYRADGNIEFLGRIDDQIKIRGYRVELEEIRTALTSHDAVEEAVVLAREDGGANMRADTERVAKLLADVAEQVADEILAETESLSDEAVKILLAHSG